MITLYSTKNCPSCTACETFFYNNEMPFHKIIVDNEESMKDMLALNGGLTTVPTLLDGDTVVVGTEAFNYLIKTYE